MNITIRDWTTKDVARVSQQWLNFCLKSTRLDMKLKPSAEKALSDWLEERFRDCTSFGLIAECDAEFAGFLLARIDMWKSVPPIVEPRKLGLIDGVYVLEPFRRYSVAASLIENATDRMRLDKAVIVETIYEVESEAATQMWRAAGFKPWMVHAYRMLYNH